MDELSSLLILGGQGKVQMNDEVQISNLDNWMDSDSNSCRQGVLEKWSWETISQFSVAHEYLQESRRIHSVGRILFCFCRQMDVQVCISGGKCIEKLAL